MKEAIGSSLLLNIALVFIGIISAILISSIAYSKAFKAKNVIIETIKNYNGDCDFENRDSCFYEIEAKLLDMGYSSNITHSCSTDSGEPVYGRTEGSVMPLDGHVYCIYKYTLCDEKTEVSGDDVVNKCSEDSSVSYYYKVVTFMHFDIPLIGSFLEFEVSGETPAFYSRIVNVKN